MEERRRPAEKSMPPLCSAEASLRICLLGIPEVWVAGQALPPLRTRKGFWLLCLLALQADRSVDRTRLAETLWPDTLPENALANLRRSLTDLRAALGVTEACIEAPTPRTLRFNASGVEVDVLTFDTDPAAALELYRGPLLQGCTEEWVFPERQRREDAYITTRLQLAEAAAMRQQLTPAASHYRAIIAVAPFEERARRGLMEVLARDGDVNAAISVYTDLRNRLHQERAMQPVAETSVLFRTLRDRARVGAKPLVRVSRKWEAPDGFLPHPATRFIGRTADQENLCTLLATERCITLVGIGGIGKTRLAIQVAEEVRDSFPDGVWFADLSGLTEAAQIPAKIATLLGLQEKVSPVRALTSRTALLVLDNVEHLQSDCAAFVEEVQTHCPRIRLLITSHAPLQLPGERVWQVSGMSLEDAVALFSERAAAVCQNFTVTPKALSELQRLCTDLDGIPLALELAAARLNVLSVPEILQRLDSRFQLLTISRQGTPARHQSLRTAISWTWSLLSATEQEYLSRLSVLRGGGTLSAAKAVLFAQPSSEYETLDALGILADKSLLVVERDQSVRYRLLDTIRQYSAAHLTNAERHAAMARLTEWCLELVFSEDSDPVAWMHRIDADWTNITAALDFCEAHPDFASKGLRLLLRLTTYCLMRGHTAEGRRRIHALLPHIPRDSMQGIDSLYYAGQFARAEGDHITARQYYAAFLAAWRAKHAENPTDRSRLELAGGLGGLAIQEMELNNLESAREYLEESLEIFRDFHLQEWISATLIRLGLVHWRSGDPHRGYTFLHEGIVLARQIDNVMCLSWNLPFLASLLQELGDCDAAEAHYREALVLQESLRHVALQADTLLALGKLIEAHDPEAARCYHEQAGALREHV